MKIFVLALLTCATAAAFAAPAPELFTPEQITLPPLGLLESTRRPVLRPTDAPPVAPAVPRLPLRSRPDPFVFPPAPGVDYQLRIARPDPTVEYHLRVIDPEVGRRR